MARPEISVLIASHDRRENLRRCLGMLVEQDLDPVDFEVIVADDGSVDGTAAMVERFEAPFELRLLRLREKGKSRALDAAIEVARAPTCLCLDDDIIAWPGLISCHVAAHRSKPMTVGLGRVVEQPRIGHDWYSQAFAADWNDRFEQLAAEPEPRWAEFHDSNFSAPRNLLLRAGSLEIATLVGDEHETAFRLRRSGGVLAYLPEAGGTRADPKPGRRLIAESRRRGRSFVALATRRPETAPTLFGDPSGPTSRHASLRRALLTLRVPPIALTPLGRLLPGSGRRRLWMRFISRYAFWRGVRDDINRELWLRISRRTPVLMYHGFAGRGESGGRYVVPRRSFRAQMRTLRLLRYRPITLSELVAALRENRPPPARAVVITIDDGYLDNLEIAAPVLARHDFKATLFLVSRRLGGANGWDVEPPIHGRPLMSAKQAAEMRDLGHELGAHTRTHCSLPDVDDAEVRDQIAGSRLDLKAELRVEVANFAYPYGRYDARAIENVEEAGFLAACTTNPARVGLDADLWQVPRIEIRGSDSILNFLRKLRLDPPDRTGL